MFYPTELSNDEYLNDQVIWADYGDWAEQVWSDADHDMTDVEADADTLTSAGWGTDEDYGYHGSEDAYLDSYWESLTEM
jgi:hypothetical protein